MTKYNILCWLTLTLLTALGHTGMAGERIGLNTTIVFARETVDNVEYGYRIPALVTTTRGTTLAFAERRVGFHDHAQNDIVLKRSFDNGKSWGPLQVIAEKGKIR